MEAAPDYKIPSWVPKLVRDEVPALLSQARDEKARAVLKRLLTHRKMRRVWRELTKQKRDLRTYKQTGTFYKHELPPLKLLSLKVSRNTLSGFFWSAYLLAVKSLSTVTEEEVLRARERLNATTVQLEQLAVEFRRWHNNPQVSGQFDTHIWSHSLPKSESLYVSGSLRLAHPWTNLNQVADELGKLALFFDALTMMVRPEEGSPVVKRRKPRGDDIRAYVLSLARSSKGYFGSSLYSVIAATASVALKKKITFSFVKRAIQRQG